MDITTLLNAEIRDTFDDKSEWVGTIGGTPITLRSSPITPFDMEMVGKKYPGFESSPTQAGCAYLICLKAVDENGQKVFTVGKHHPLVMRLGSAKISEIFAALFGDDFAKSVDLGDDAVGRAEGN